MSWSHLVPPCSTHGGTSLTTPRVYRPGGGTTGTELQGDAGQVVELLAAILAGQPRLPGAACRQHVELFDRAADGDRRAAQEAVAICGRCPVAETCQAWIATMPHSCIPVGVIAGQHLTPSCQPRGRPNKRAERSELFASLRQSGLSYRAIAVATGTSEPTVRRALTDSKPTTSKESDR